MEVESLLKPFLPHTDSQHFNEIKKTYNIKTSLDTIFFIFFYVIFTLDLGLCLSLYLNLIDSDNSSVYMDHLPLLVYVYLPIKPDVRTQDRPSSQETTIGG